MQHDKEFLHVPINNRLPKLEPLSYDVKSLQFSKLGNPQHPTGNTYSTWIFGSCILAGFAEVYDGLWVLFITPPIWGP